MIRLPSSSHQQVSPRIGSSAAAAYLTPPTHGPLIWCLDPQLPTKPDRPASLHTATSLPIPETLDFNHVIKKQRAYDYWQEI